MASLRQQLPPSRTWMRWDANDVEALLGPDLDLPQVAILLARLLVHRVLGGTGRGTFFLFRYVTAEDRYQQIGAWSVPGFFLVDASSIGEADAEDPRQLFIPFEADGYVLGYGLLKSGENERIERPDEEEITFLGRMGGVALSRALEADRVMFAHRALASTHRYLEAVLELQSDAVLLLDPDGRILAANDAVENVLGRFPIDLVGRLATEVLANDTALTLLTGAHLAGGQDEPFHRLLRLVPAGEETGREFEMSFSAVRLDLEANAGAIIRIRDLESARSVAWFEERASVGEAARGEALLRPIAALRGYLGLLRDELPPRRRVRELLRTLDLQTEWLQSQLESQFLLDEFCGARGRWRDRPVAPSVLIERSLSRVRSRLEARGVRVLRQVNDERPWVRVDVEKWVVALTHLFDVLASRLGGPGVLHVEETLGPDARVALRIKGERIRTSPREDADVYQSGIPENLFSYGLPLAHSVVHHYGGTLVVDLSPGSGPQADLTLPCEQPESTASQRSA